MATVESWKVFINHSRTAASSAGLGEYQGCRGLAEKGKSKSLKATATKTRFLRLARSWATFSRAQERSWGRLGMNSDSSFTRENSTHRSRCRAFSLGSNQIVDFGACVDILAQPRLSGQGSGP